VEKRFVDYYGRELRYLRELGGEFARDFPKVAARLGLDASDCADPYVERLLEGFAFLAARAQVRLDADFQRFTEPLLQTVCPNYVAPTPSMAVVQLHPDDQHGSLDGFMVPRGTALRASPHRSDAIACEYSTAHDVRLWPIELRSASVGPLIGALPVALPHASRRPVAALTLRLGTMDGLPFSELALDDLTFFFRGGDSVAPRLFDACMAGAIAMFSRDPGGRTSWTRLERASLHARGLGEEDALLPRKHRVFEGHVLLHEYFAFPQRFLFADLRGLSAGVRACRGPEIELLILLDRHDPALDRAVSAASLALFCTPAINLFRRRADRISLIDRDEWHVVVDRKRPRDFEVHSIQSVTGYSARDQVGRSFLPFHRMDAREPTSAYFTVQRSDQHVAHHADPARKSYLGSETLVSPVDWQGAPFSGDLRQLSVETLCTNRDLPLLMPNGSGKTDFFLESGAPVRAIRCVAGPSAPRGVLARGEIAWKLIATLYNVGLNDAPDAVGSLREVLALFADAIDPSAHRRVHGIRSAMTRPVVRKLPLDGPPTFGQGLEVALDCDDSAFDGSSVYILGSALGAFFRRHVSTGSFVETVVRTDQRGEVVRFPLRTGSRGVV
jgi:type VI secretion system protein ImpG